MKRMPHGLGRHMPKAGLDNYPTPPWATRALLERVGLPGDVGRALDPGCGAGHMVKVLRDYIPAVVASDIFDYRLPDQYVFDYATEDPAPWSRIDATITNPPFQLAEKFIARALRESRVCVAMLLRTVFLESVSRYQKMFSRHPPSTVAVFSERVPMTKGRLNAATQSMVSYSWFLWELDDGKPIHRSTELIWIPPCRKTLSRDNDFSDPRF